MARAFFWPRADAFHRPWGRRDRWRGDIPRDDRKASSPLRARLVPFRGLICDLRLFVRARPFGVLLNRTRGHFARCVSAVDPEAHARHRLRRDGAIGRLPDHPMGTRPRRVSAQHSLRSASAERERNVAHLVLARLIVIQPRLGSSAEAGQRSV